MSAHSLLPSLPRPRLINIIGATVSEMAPLTLLQAPSGFGKTTMVRHWTLHVEHSPSRELGPLLWAPLYGVSDADSSWSQVALAVGVDPTEDPFPSVCEWATKLDDTHVLIIENYEEATTPELDRTLVDLVSSAPNLRVVLLAQEVSVLRNPLLSAEVRMQIPLDSDLRFSRGEAERLIALAQTQSSAARQRLGQDAAAYRTGDELTASEYLQQATTLARDHSLSLRNTMVPFEDLTDLCEAGIGAAPENRALHGFQRKVLTIPLAAQLVRHEALTPAELQTLRAMVGGASVAQVAERLFLSTNTVKFHQRAIYRKLGAKNKYAALSKATKLGLLNDHYGNRNY